MKTILAAMLAVLAAPLAAQDALEGQLIYQTYCATCHGVDAQGGGPMSATLILQPPDLTRMAERNDGVFPTTRAAMRIDGRDPLVSHGSPMPVYGDYFEGNDTPIKLETGQPMMTSRTLADVVAFLEGIQAE
ncbi:cytochrome c [Octadecabacter sp. 1_MG-2023]|uniref:c-type cytochrome n=1 Tax=unclassified Octadecabacter TaxID=196158 RepID=UPI001C080479|nr:MULTISPECIES: cytochrome c [unclassified Octadecabacter]MBU2993888.1 cytochrome c [Octadecabacter sp. B2R22]MDO6735266.1 cytochrome c [Octadecabacter sp. 1_MG-2023]